MSVNRNLGHATAYGYAKSKGYTGTEEEFAELMASYAEVAEDAAQSAANAAASATTANNAADDATAAKTAAEAAKTAAQQSATSAATSAQTAITKANEATASASNAVMSAATAQAAAQSVSAQSEQIDVNKANTKGTNLLYNGQPHLSHAFNQGSGNIGWTKSVTSGVNVEWVGDEYIHMRAYSWSISATDNKICQLNKYYKLNGEVYASEHGDEIADFVDGADGVISFEVKANNTVKITSTLLVSFTDDTQTIRTFEAEQTISNDGEWHSFVVADTVPNNWQTLVRQANVKNARMSVDIYTTTSTDTSLGDLNVYVKNVKFEYGTEATPFSYSQADNTDILNNTLHQDADSGWDAVIRLIHADDSGGDLPANLTPSIVSGTFAQLYGKISSDEYPYILVEYLYPVWGYRFAVPMAYITYASDGAIEVLIAGYSVNEGIFKRYGTLLWLSDDTIEWAG